MQATPYKPLVLPKKMGDGSMSPFGTASIGCGAEVPGTRTALLGMSASVGGVVLVAPHLDEVVVKSSLQFLGQEREGSVASCFIDNQGEFAYFGLSTGQLMQVLVSDMAVSKAVDLKRGPVVSMYLDWQAGMAYVVSAGQAKASAKKGAVQTASGPAITQVRTRQVCENDCSHHGQCDHGVCQCNPYYQGVDCAHYILRNCPVDCTLHGSCLDGRCLCLPGWKGEDCMECEWDCSGHGACLSSATACVCQEGWHGDHCNKITLKTTTTSTTTQPPVQATAPPAPPFPWLLVVGGCGIVLGLLSLCGLWYEHTKGAGELAKKGSPMPSLVSRPDGYTQIPNKKGY